MSHDWVRRFARGLWLLVVLLTVGGVALFRLDRAHYTADTSPLDLAIYGLVALIYASVGALIVSRRSNAVGWLFCVMATGLTLFTFGSAYAVHGLVVDPGSLPGATFAAWLVWATLVPGLAPVILVFLLFPDGHPPTRRWRPVAWITLAGMAGLTVCIQERSTRRTNKGR